MDKTDAVQKSMNETGPNLEHQNWIPKRGGYRGRYGGYRGSRGRGRDGFRFNRDGGVNQLTCFICGDKDNFQRDCPTILRQMGCSKCKEKGHIVKKLTKSLCAQAVGSNLGTKQEGPKLVGDTNEVSAFVNNIKAKALLDTGSCVMLFQILFISHTCHMYR